MSDIVDELRGHTKVHTVSLKALEKAADEIERLRTELSEVLKLTEWQPTKHDVFQLMLDIVNVWHREVGIDDVMASNLTQKIADVKAEEIIASWLERTRPPSEDTKGEG